MKARLFFVVLFLLVAISPAGAAVTSFAVTNQAMTAYLFNGGPPNPTLTLVRGNTYNFVGMHPGTLSI